MTYSTFPDVRATSIQRHNSTWVQLVEQLRAPTEYESKPHCPLIKLAEFGENRTAGGCLRSDANLVRVYGLEGDYDGELMSVDQAAHWLNSYGIEALIYTSASHQHDRPRWRVVAPLAKPCAPSERRAYMAKLNAVFDGQLSPESFTASQAYYYGKVKGSSNRPRLDATFNSADNWLLSASARSSARGRWDRKPRRQSLKSKC